MQMEEDGEDDDKTSDIISQDSFTLENNEGMQHDWGLSRNFNYACIS